MEHFQPIVLSETPCSQNTRHFDSQLHRRGRRTAGVSGGGGSGGGLGGGVKNNSEEIVKKV